MLLDAVQVQAILPHRYPFLFIDRVIEVGEDSIHAQKLVSISDPILQGHFPGNPILPGVVQVETMAQAAIVLANKVGHFDPETQVCFFMGIQEAKFRAPVVPGDLLDVMVKAERLGRIGKFVGEIRCGGDVRSSAKFTAIVEKKPEPASES
jgi:3-hydroxyacyl-[acyl-carrier-protein] dehydratase